jgi:hypothetical protein
MGRFASWSRRSALVAVGVLLTVGLGAGSAPSQTVHSSATRELTVSIINQGGLDGEAPWGHVSSDPSGIDCPPTCSAQFESGTTVQLSSDAAPGYSLARWDAFPNAPECAEGPICSLTIDDQFNPSVQASFQPAAELQAMTAGPGRLSISPTQPGLNALCKVDGQQEDPDSTCIQRYTTGTPVTLRAEADPGARFIGWSDFGCARYSQTCTLTLGAGERYITARFSPVKLTVQGGDFGSVVVETEPGGTCTFAEGAPPCEFTYPAGTVVTIRREHESPGNFWIGGCDGNSGGTLDADVCRIRLQANELVGAGLSDPTAIPPPRGSGITVKRVGKGRVTGQVINGGGTLNCGGICTISGLTRYDQVRLRARASRGSRFAHWSDGSRLPARVVRMSAVNRIKATFSRRR